MGLTIPVAHDFNCPWCWIGMFQARRLRRDFGATIEWRGYELYPDDLELPGDPPERPTIPNRPETPKRIELALAAEGLDPIDLSLDSATRTHHAHEALEYAKQLGVQDELIERIYFAYWKEGRDIDATPTLLDLAKGLIEDPNGMERAIEERRFADKIVPYNKPAYANGVFNVPTFWIHGERYAEQPYSVLSKAMEGSHPPLPSGEGPGVRASIASPSAPYPSLDFPPPPPDRPYVFINMVSTIDGKTVSGSREEGVMDLGSAVDHQAMRNIESAAEAVMIGAQTLRSTPKVRFDPRLFRIVVSRSGNVNPTVRFFTDAPGRAIVATSGKYEPLSAGGVPEGEQEGSPGSRSGATLGTPNHIHRHPEGVQENEKADIGRWTFTDVRDLLVRIRRELGVTRLLVEGGSELNASILKEDLADELFLTMAPKVRLGRELPTYAGGNPLPKGQLMGFSLISEQRVGDEVFLRYRRNRA